jgi:L-fucose mutarotase
MIRGKLIHPPILEALSASGHGGKVLITDSNFAFSTNANPAAKRVFLNVMPGRMTVTEILEAIISAIPVEAVDVMATDTGEEPEIWQDFRELLPGYELCENGRFEFYEKALGREVCLVVASGDTRLFANILLTIGFIPTSS